MELQHALGIDLVLGQCRSERDSAQRHRRSPVLEFLRTLAAANAEIVSNTRIGPTSTAFVAEKLAPEQFKALIRAGYVYRNGDEHFLTDKGRDALAQLRV